MRRKWGVVALVVAAGVALPALRADAHAVFVSGTNLPVNTVQNLVMNVPHERGDEFWNVKVEIAVPAGWQAQSCVTKSTWTCGITPSGNFQVITWSKGSGAPPAEDETFRFTVRTASSPGSYAFPTIQTYSDGDEAEWIGESGSPEPAPRLTTVPATTGPTTTRPPPPPPTHVPTTRPSGQPHTTNPGDPSSPTSLGATPTTGPGEATTTTNGTDDTSTTTDRSTTTTDERADDDDRDPDDTSATTDGEGAGEVASGPDSNEGGGGGAAPAFALGALVVLGGGAAGVVLWRRRAAG